LPSPGAKRKGWQKETFRVTQLYRRLVTMVLHLCAVLLAAPALAAPTNITPQLLVEGPAAPGGEVTLALRMKPSPGWHGYWQNPGDAGQGMTPEWPPAGPPRWVAALSGAETLLISGLMNHVYEHDYAVLTTLKVPRRRTARARIL
jgi:hypothetical protein